MHEFTSMVKWNGGKEGMYELGNGAAGMFSSPPEFDGTEGVMTPEDALVGSINMCYMQTFLVFKGKLGLGLREFECETVGTLEQIDGVYQFTKVIIKPRIVCDNEATARRCADYAKKYCLVTASMTSENVVEPEIIEQM